MEDVAFLEVAQAPVALVTISRGMLVESFTEEISLQKPMPKQKATSTGVHMSLKDGCSLIVTRSTYQQGLWQYFAETPISTKSTVLAF